MDTALVQTIARELLDLPLTDEESAALVAALVAQREILQALGQVPLSYSAEPFVTPRASEAWLENWRDE